MRRGEVRPPWSLEGPISDEEELVTSIENVAVLHSAVTSSGECMMVVDEQGIVPWIATLISTSTATAIFRFCR